MDSWMQTQQHKLCHILD